MSLQAAPVSASGQLLWRKKNPGGSLVLRGILGQREDETCNSGAKSLPEGGPATPALRWTVYTMEYYSAIKRNETLTGGNLDGSGGHDGK
jgi:hypothetical protein